MARHSCSLLAAVLFLSCILGATAFTPPKCPASTPAPGTAKCSLVAPNDTEFGAICNPGHAGGAEQPANRCGGVKYTDGVFRCACCGAPLFVATSFYPGPPGDGWPAFFGNGSFKANGTDHVCSPGGSEVVCSNCGTHLGDFFPAGTNNNKRDYYCIDGVCLLPPGATGGHVCQPQKPPSEAEALMAFRKLAQKGRIRESV